MMMRTLSLSADKAWPSEERRVRRIKGRRRMGYCSLEHMKIRLLDDQILRFSDDDWRFLKVSGLVV
jgi:hypothetical protein